MSFQDVLGNLAFILFVLMIFTGVIWALDTFKWEKQRRSAAQAALAEFDARNARLVADGIKVQTGGRQEIENALLKQPTWIEYTGSFFPVIALVFCLRSFLFEPFQIPSGSMLPTLYVGDLILVNKFTYGIRLPIIDKKIIQINDPQRGDVMVFRYPEDPSKNYIKRVVGVPGDKIVYKNKRLTVNGKQLSYTDMPDFLPENDLTYVQQYKEDLTGVSHRILNRATAPNSVNGPHQFPFRENCVYDEAGFECSVPPENYFMMGDNRDNSEDSRYWGFVPDKNIVGKALVIWMNWSNLSRIGRFQ